MKNKTLLSASLALMMAMNAETGKLRTVVEERANTFVNSGSRLQPRSILIWMLIMWQSTAVRQADRRVPPPYCCMAISTRLPIVPVDVTTTGWTKSGGTSNG